MGKHHRTTLPNESAAYRQARDELLEAERGLRRQVEHVAALRRRLPEGGALAEDYLFEEGPADLEAGDAAREIRFSALFGGHDTLALYSFMYGPDDEAPCPMCSAFLDSLDGAAPHLGRRIGLAVGAKAPLVKLRAWALRRGWRHLRLVSTGRGTYNRDYGGEDGEGDQLPAFNVFRRRDGRIGHFYNAELLYVPMEPGQDPRHLDLMWPLWSLLDTTPEGRGADWYPATSYD